MADIIDGKKIASEVRDEVRQRAERLAGSGVVPSLAAILVGDDPASETYVRMKRRDAEECGMTSTLNRMSARAEGEDLADLIDGLNADASVHGILLQLPLPKHLDPDSFLLRIDPAKDVDGLHPVNQGLLAQGSPRFVPCTPLGVQQMLVRSGIEVAGQHVVVVGRSVLVGKPLSMLLSNRGDGANATVTLCHTGTRDLVRHTREADILIVAAGVAKMIGPDHVSEGAVVIDVGTNVADDGKLVGDVDFENVSKVVRAITPVPGGVGPMTRAMLLHNTVLAAERSVAG
ncbi:MAG TPA: bifunctional 5,10-methylenetetrahydrofolate dehydrogenase/5,10-methenyltetrahydrofolate cyclohydrolase [Actinomycetota bacterium]|nr:bifunctional 5,10-methylenetetrahydrofolate dehydrogenase/5,10-methenyltetrahydrofolate cyclohydrolase [Actinomycetota bacterium]